MRWVWAILMCASLQAQEWTRVDTAYEAGCVAALALDWGQTLDIQRCIASRHDTRETNAIIGPHPSRAAVNCYFGAVIVGHVLTAALLPPRYRRTFQGATLGLELAVVGRNFALGFKVSF
jgi:hypothetical protein